MVLKSKKKMVVKPNSMRPNHLVALKRRYVDPNPKVEEKPPSNPMKVHDSGVSEEILSNLVEAFDLLYDPNFLGHLPPNQRLKHFKQRNLAESKLYKSAMTIFGHQAFVRQKLAINNGRKRVFVATKLDHPSNNVEFQDPDHKFRYKPQYCSYSTKVNDIDAPSSEDKVEQYKTWLQNRQKMQKELDEMGNVESYLRGKSTSMSDLEKRMMQKIEVGRQNHDETSSDSEDEKRAKFNKHTSKVMINRPSPLALFIIDTELKKRKIRLHDLFTDMDKDKDWLLSRDEFRKAMQKHKVPIPEPLLEDLIISLDQDNNNELDYRELAQGLESFRREKRSPTFKEVMRETKLSYIEASKANVDKKEKSESPENNDQKSYQDESNRPLSGDSLKAGEFDTSQERFTIDNAEMTVDLRKRDKVALKHILSHKGSKLTSSNASQKTMIKTFDRAIDDHMSLSTLPEARLADMVDDFRQQQLKEYINITQMCQNKGVPFSEPMLKKVMLYPADKPTKQISHKISQPGTKSTLSAALYVKKGSGSQLENVVPSYLAEMNKPKRYRTVNLARAGSALPTEEDLVVDDDDAEQELVTGTTMIRRKVDCWLTFEEFQKLTANINYSEDQMNMSRPGKSAFWPNLLEGRVRRYLDNDSFYGSHLMFQSTVPRHRSNPIHPYQPKQTWPLNSYGLVTYGDIDPMIHHNMKTSTAAGVQLPQLS